MTKRNVRSLSAAIGGLEPEAQVALEQTPATPPAAAKVKPVGILLYVSAEDHERIRNLSFHSKTSLQKLGLEAWSLLLEKRGLDPLEIVTASTPSGRVKA